MPQFGGDKKVGQSILGPIEKRFIVWAVPKVPTWIHSAALTYATIPISLCIIGCSFLAAQNIHWLWGVSLLIFLQWLTDSLDGAVGRMRNTGLVRWGYYMDHFLDYIFLCSILIGYSFILPQAYNIHLFFILMIFGAFMVDSFLSFASTNNFRISHLGIGPTEVRLLFIIVNTLFIYFGKTYMAGALPYVLAFSLLGLIYIVAKTSKMLWKIDMENKTSAK